MADQQAGKKRRVFTFLQFTGETARVPTVDLDRLAAGIRGREAREVALPAVREAVKRCEPQHVAWAFERSDGGRGFGFTGAHFHNNWANDDFRKLVLNAILWTAQMDVPGAGVKSQVTPEQMTQNLDAKPPRKKS